MKGRKLNIRESVEIYKNHKHPSWHRRTLVNYIALINIYNYNTDTGFVTVFYTKTNNYSVAW